MEKGKYRPCLRKALRRLEKEKSASAGGSLGALLLVKAKESGDYSEAQKICEEAYESFRYDKSVMGNMAELYFLTGKNDEAKEIFEELISLRPDTPAPFYNYALLLTELGEYSEAEEMLDRALRCRFTALTPISKRDVESKRTSLSA